MSQCRERSRLHRPVGTGRAEREPPGRGVAAFGSCTPRPEVSADAIDHAVPVVKLQVVVARGLPAASRMAAGPPVRVAVYFVLAARVAFGFSVRTRVVAL